MTETSGTAAPGLDEKVPLVAVSREGPLPLSFEQERVWRFSQTPEAAAGWTTVVCERWRGPLDVPALRRAIDYIAGRHEILRTVFVVRDGRPVQVVKPRAPVDLPVVDLSGTPDALDRAEELVRREASTPFDLERGPLLRLWLARVGPDQHLFVRIVQHIVFDARSWAIFYEELHALYEDFRHGQAASLPDRLTFQYADYAAWQRRVLAPGQKRYERDVAWWRAVFDRPERQRRVPWWRRVLTWTRTLPPPPPSPLPLALGWDRAPGQLRPSDGVIRVRLPLEVLRRFEAVIRKAPASLFMGVLAGFTAHVALETQRSVVDVGSYMTSRRRVELDGLFGLFSNLVPLRLDVRGATSLRSWLGQVRDVVLDALEHASLPYETLCDLLSAEGKALPRIHAIVAVSPLPGAVRVGDVEVTLVDMHQEGWPWGFSWYLEQDRNEFWLRTTFDPRLYDPAKVRCFIDRHLAFLDGASAAPERPLADVLREAGAFVQASSRGRNLLGQEG